MVPEWVLPRCDPLQASLGLFNFLSEARCAHTLVTSRTFYEEYSKLIPLRATFLRDASSLCRRVQEIGSRTWAKMGDSNLFSDNFTVTNIKNMKYESVARLSANTENGDTFLTLDVNTELFPCSVGDRLQLLLASTLALDGSKDDGKGWRDVGTVEASLADDYDYVCHGKIYRFEEGDEENM